MFGQGLTKKNGWTSVEFNKANTVKNAKHLTSDEKRIMLYINLIRVNPQRFADLFLIVNRTHTILSDTKNAAAIKMESKDNWLCGSLYLKFVY